MRRLATTATPPAPAAALTTAYEIADTREGLEQKLAELEARTAAASNQHVQAVGVSFACGLLSILVVAGVWRRTRRADASLAGSDYSGLTPGAVVE